MPPCKIYPCGSKTIVEGVSYDQIMPLLRRYRWYGLGSKQCYTIYAHEDAVRKHLNKLGMRV